MKILVVSDFHFSDTHKFPNKKLRMNRDVEAYANFMEKIAPDYDKVIFAGDFFDKPNPSIGLINRINAMNSVRHLTELIYLAGNHDHTEDYIDSPLFAVAGSDLNHWYHQDMIIDNIILMSHFRSPEKFFACLGYYLTRIGKSLPENVYIVCHQYFDCCCSFETDEMISYGRLRKLLLTGKENTYFHIISGHLHQKDHKSGEQNSIYSVGIPLQQSFSDIGQPSTAVVIDTEKNTVEHIEMDICDSEFILTTAHAKIHSKKHFLKVNINDDIDEKYANRLTSEGHHVQPNYISQDNIPDKLDREKQNKEYTKEDIVNETVDELGEGSEELKEKGKEFLEDVK